jgi:hypothetical protein
VTPLAKRRRPKKRRCRTVVDKKTKRRKKVCRPAPEKKRRLAERKPVVRPLPRPAVAPAPVSLPDQPAPSAAAPPVTAAVGSDPTPGGGGSDPGTKPDPKPEGLPRQQTFGAREAERLLWRAGFGPLPGQVETVAALGLEAAVYSLTRPSGAETLLGDGPSHDGFGRPYTAQRAAGEYGGNVAWWFIHMVRSDQPLRQRMALIWHDWFATADRGLIGRPRMLQQYELFRRSFAGNFRRLALDVTVDEAMCLWLNGLDNHKGAPNENYARELMELFTLGADRGAYTETDVRQLARVLTGYHADHIGGGELGNFRFAADRHDAGTKTLWVGKPYERTGAFGWKKPAATWECDAVDLCLQHPLHASFFVRKLWSYFVPSEPPAQTQALLEKLYVDGGYEVRPVLEAILMHPDLYSERRLVKPPAVFVAGLFRGTNRAIRHSGLDGWLETAGQRLFDPPDVAGWRDHLWLDTNTLFGRAECVRRFLEGRDVPVDESYPAAETPAQALDAALAAWGGPALTAGSRDVLLRFAASVIDDSILTPGERSRQRAKRQNALRFLVALSPDHHTC